MWDSLWIGNDPLQVGPSCLGLTEVGRQLGQDHPADVGGQARREVDGPIELSESLVKPGRSLERGNLTGQPDLELAFERPKQRHSRFRFGPLTEIDVGILIAAACQEPTGQHEDG